jgi:hypothetical protein
MQQGQRTDLIPSANLQNVSQTLKRYGVEQHAHVIVLGAPMHSRALDIFRLFLLCR